MGISLARKQFASYTYMVMRSVQFRDPASNMLSSEYYLGPLSLVVLCDRGGLCAIKSKLL
jgi:hypothetical protein